MNVGDRVKYTYEKTAVRWPCLLKNTCKVLTHHRRLSVMRRIQIGDLVSLLEDDEIGTVIDIDAGPYKDNTYRNIQVSWDTRNPCVSFWYKPIDLELIVPPKEIIGYE